MAISLHRIDANVTTKLVMLELRQGYSCSAPFQTCCEAGITRTQTRRFRKGGLAMSGLSIKALLIISFAILATGCKLALTVTSGGDVTSLTGNRDCSGGSLVT